MLVAQPTSNTVPLSSFIVVLLHLKIKRDIQPELRAKSVAEVVARTHILVDYW